MAKQLFLALILSWVCVEGVLAQDKLDVVTLNGGRILRGTVQEQLPDSSIYFKGNDGTLYRIPASSIASIGVEYLPEAEHPTEKRSFNLTKLSLLRTPHESLIVGAGTIHGFRFGQYVTLAAGAEWNNYSAMSLFPLFIDLRGRLLTGNILPLLYGQAGYAMGVMPTGGGGDGPMFGVGAGVEILLSRNLWMSVDAGYRSQVTVETRVSSYWDPFDGQSSIWSSTYTERVDLFTFSVGISY